MRVMVMIRADKNTEAGVMPSEKLLTEMGKFNEELVKAGIMLAGEGLHPSSRGKRVRFSGGKKAVIDGPFAETKELIAGFWIIEVSSREQAVEWACRVPLVDGRVELREAVFQILPVTYDDRFERPCDGEIRPIDEILEHIAAVQFMRRAQILLGL